MTEVVPSDICSCQYFFHTNGGFPFWPWDKDRTRIWYVCIHMWLVYHPENQGVKTEVVSSHFHSRSFPCWIGGRQVHLYAHEAMAPVLSEKWSALQTCFSRMALSLLRWSRRLRYLFPHQLRLSMEHHEPVCISAPAYSETWFYVVLGSVWRPPRRAMTGIGTQVLSVASPMLTTAWAISVSTTNLGLQ